MIELEVSDIRNAQAPSEAFAMVLKERFGERLLPIIIGMSEARAIVLEMNKMKPKRPTPHDLILQLSAACQVVADKVEIHKFEEGIFYARIRFSNPNNEIFYLDSRTSDAVVLALKWDIPIFIEEEIIDTYLNNTDIDMNSLLADDDSTPTDNDEYESTLSDEGYDQYISSKLEEMSLDELENLLDGAVECEDFEMASKIHEEIEKRKKM